MPKNIDELKIDYDDNPLDTMNAVNKLLLKYGFQFINDEKEHDGYEIYILTQTTEPAKEN